MREIIFEEIGMENYGPYIEPMILSIENNKLTLITGPNGVGKSMILDALPFTFFGITSKGARGDDVVNNKTGKGCHTWAKFSIDSIPYRTERYHKYPKLGNTVHLFRNNETKPYKKGHSEVLPEIERLICPFKLFMNTLLFAQKVKNFFTDLTDSEKKEIFRKILALDNYVDYYNETTELRKTEVEKQLQLVNQLSLKNELLNEAKNWVVTLTKEKNDFEIQKQKDLVGYENKILQLDKYEKQISEKIPEIDSSKLNNLMKQSNKIENDIDGLEDKLSSIELEVKTQKKSKEVELKNSSLEAKQKLSDEYPLELNKINDMYIDKIDKVKKEIIELEEKQSIINEKIRQSEFSKSEVERQKDELDVDSLEGLPNCPTCLQPITEESRLVIKNKIDDYSKKIESILEDKRKLLIRSEEIKQLVESVKTELEKYIFERDVKQNELKTRNDQQVEKIDLRLSSVLEQLDSLAEKMVTDKVQSIKNEKKILEGKLDLVLAEIGEERNLVEYYQNMNSKVADIEKEKDVIKKLMSEKIAETYDPSNLNSFRDKTINLETEIEKIQRDLKIVTKDLEVLDFWKVGFSSSGIPSLLIDDSIPFMNTTISDYLDQISNGRYTVSFDTLKATKAGEFRDKISVNVLDNVMKSNKRVQFSGGQTRIVDIATILTLCDLQSVVQDVSFNLLLFDEIFDSLDDDNTGFVSKVLRGLVRSKAIFIISHTHIDQIEADEVLQLK